MSPTTADIFADRCRPILHDPDAEQKIRQIIIDLRGRIYDGDFDPALNNLDEVPSVFIVFPDDTTASSGNYGSGWFAEPYGEDDTKYKD